MNKKEYIEILTGQTKYVPMFHCRIHVDDIKYALCNSDNPEKIILHLIDRLYKLFPKICSNLD
jgi:hypothetical protein